MLTAPANGWFVPQTTANALEVFEPQTTAVPQTTASPFTITLVPQTTAVPQTTTFCCQSESWANNREVFPVVESYTAVGDSAVPVPTSLLFNAAHTSR